MRRNPRASERCEPIAEPRKAAEVHYRSSERSIAMRLMITLDAERVRLLERWEGANMARVLERHGYPHALRAEIGGAQVALEVFLKAAQG